MADTEGRVAVLNPRGMPATIPESQLQEALERGYTLEAPQSYGERVAEAQYGDSPILATAEGAARGLTFGGSDLLLGQLGEGTAQRKARNPGAALLGEGASLLAPFGAPGLIGKAGRAVEGVVAGTDAVRALDAGGAAAQLLGGAAKMGARAGAEGALFGAGTGISEVALSEDPVNAEAIASALGGNMLFGGLTAAGAGAGLSALGSVAKAAAVRARNAAGRWTEAVAADVAAKAPEAAPAFGKEVQALREEARSLGGELPAIAAKGGAEGQGFIREINQAERSLGNVAKLPKAIERSPGRALEALEGYEQTLRQFGAALPSEAAAPVLALADRSAALQARLEASVAKPSTATVGQQIVDAAKERAFSAGSAAIGGAAGHMIGGPLGALTGAVVGAGLGALRKRLASSSSEFVAELGAKLDAAIGGAERVAPALAEQMSLGVSFGARAIGADKEDDRHQQVQDVITAAANPDEARRRIHDGLTGVRMVDPKLADQLENQAMNRLQYLSGVAPKDPGLGAPGQDRWTPTDTEMAKFARVVAVTEQPMRLLDHLSSDTMTPTVVDAVKTVFPEVYKRIQRLVLEKLVDPNGPVLTTQRKLGLAMLTGSPIDSRLKPEYLQAQQQRYAQMRAEAEKQKGRGTAPPPRHGVASDADLTAVQAAHT